MLSIEGLSVSVGETPILRDVSLSVGSGEIVAVLGRNGSGKSSLALAAMGHPDYRTDSGVILLDGTPIQDLPPEERAARGLFLAMQRIPEIPGLRIGEYLRSLANLRTKRLDPAAKPVSPFVFGRYIRPFLDRVGIPEAFLQRDLHVGLSGGERRRMELLQAFVLEPSVLVFDETDSGLDIDAVSRFAGILPELAARGAAVLVVTHNLALLESVAFDRICVLESGVVSETGGREILDRLRTPAPISA
jgi:Fe-S cluster assembly ATP-binding protein